MFPDCWIDLGMWNAATGFLLPDTDENSVISEVLSSCNLLRKKKHTAISLAEQREADSESLERYSPKRTLVNS